MGPKSEIKDAFCKVGFGDMFTDDCPFFSVPHFGPSIDVSVILDFLYYIHRPPPPDISTYDYFQYLWNIVISGNVDICKYLYIVIDKPDYLPPPRKLVHEARRKKSGCFRGVEPVIVDNAPLPHGKIFEQLLALPSFKSKLIHFITKKTHTGLH